MDDNKSVEAPIKDEKALVQKELEFDPKKIDIVDIDSVRPNTWNPKDKDTDEYNALVESLKENGLKTFIVVRENKGETDNDRFEIIDGEQKWRGCKQLGFKKVIIYNEGTVDDQKAQELTLWWQVQVPFNELSLAQMVTNMVEKFQEVHTPYAQEKIEEMQKLVKFDWGQYGNTSTKPPEMPNSELLKSFTVQVTNSQYDIIIQALNKAKKAVKDHADTEVTDSRALEFVCVEYINTPEGN